MDYLKRDLIVDEQKNTYTWNKSGVKRTTGKIKIRIIINNNEIIINFHVVGTRFSIIKHGIFDVPRAFLKCAT